MKREINDEKGNLTRAVIFRRRYLESDTALLNRVLGREIGGKQNILVMNDEAHHAYRIRQQEPDPDEDEASPLGSVEDDEELVKEATIWVDGLDRIHKHRGINFCIDLSATPYFLARVGRDNAKPFPWVVSDFGLVDAIESGLVKIPQLAVSDTSGAERAKYFNIWKWIMGKLSSAERGGRRGSPKPEAILKYAHHPIAMLAGQWQEELRRWVTERDDPRPPVFILVCKDTKIAKAVYEWIAEDKCPSGIPSFGVDDLRNRAGETNTIRVDSKVIAETDSGATKGDAKSDLARWMRFTLDTVGKRDWPTDRQGRALYPEGFEDLAKKLDRPLHPPGRDVRCIVSVGMLTEGWDANTVTHIIGIRPFMSQLLCEQVVGRGLRRASYDVDENGRFTEEIAQVFGVPFEVIPFKATSGTAPLAPKRFHVHALPARARYEIRFPRVEGYTQAVRNRVTVNWSAVPKLRLSPESQPTVVKTRGFAITSDGSPSVSGMGASREVTLQPYHASHRIQQIAFELARDLTRSYGGRGQSIPAHALFPQMRSIVARFIDEKVEVPDTSDLRDLRVAPYYGWAQEILLEAIQPDTSRGEAPEIPRYEALRGVGSTADVDYWTSKDVREVTKSHVNYVVADTGKWEQQAAFHIDRHPQAEAFVKNAGLGFAIPYLHNGQMHDYVPDFIIRIKNPVMHLILETKGFDPLEEVKRAAAERWVNAVNADGRHGVWRYALAKSMGDVTYLIGAAAQEATEAALST